MNRILIALLLIAMAAAALGCGKREAAAKSQEMTKNEYGYVSISMDEAKQIFNTPGEYIVLDVRRADEFAEGHIPGAVNVANESISDKAPAELPDKAQIIYVYCRSGRRSKEAAAKLAAIGYTNIIEIGGILDWNGAVEK